MSRNLWVIKIYYNYKNYCDILKNLNFNEFFKKMNFMGYFTLSNEFLVEILF